MYTECIHFFYDEDMLKRYPGVLGKCFKNNKVQFDTSELAQAAAKLLRKKKGSKTRPYECPHCGFWHIGHDRPPEFRKQR